MHLNKPHPGQTGAKLTLSLAKQQSESGLAGEGCLLFCGLQ